ncbi:hypothetical protein SARC_00104 [Sphaeroforma arctica JP610]|uniref:Uncharacterized protein n=1 Tax=Sphaeroforma arctica JP610 TaxID=667725 RepID=A0A0L0GFP2_9EUKA|nr:hypothetical protein SARC_00104 [Sphaeroforma arctica JP610]KNC87847.1 hypothetical protein SARC_00104 [Sphaeroforma arctica JP610]|eukprot:XP_014161749.1 hypothetical protein SARC_00104 [Sphaeroforma arctica JP610]
MNTTYLMYAVVLAALAGGVYWYMYMRNPTTEAYVPYQTHRQMPAPTIPQNTLRCTKVPGSRPSDCRYSTTEVVQPAVTGADALVGQMGHTPIEYGYGEQAPGGGCGGGYDPTCGVQDTQDIIIDRNLVSLPRRSRNSAVADFFRGDIPIEPIHANLKDPSCPIVCRPRADPTRDLHAGLGSVIYDAGLDRERRALIDRYEQTC